MITMSDFSFSLEISGLIVFGIILLILLVIFVVWLCKKKRNNFSISAIDVGMAPNITLSLDNSDRQIAYKVWVEINTRTIAVMIDLDKDNIKVVNDSYHSCFLSTRELIKEIPVSKIQKNSQLVLLLTNFLNNLLRPYLTKWGVKYKDWYEAAQKENESNSIEDKTKYKSFIQIQRSFPEYEALTKDLLEINKKVVSFSEQLYQIAFNSKSRKEQ